MGAQMPWIMATCLGGMVTVECGRGTMVVECDRGIMVVMLW
jgi:hypothetical protein